MTDNYYPVQGDEVELPFYLLGAGARDREEHFVREDGYPGYQIVCCVKGAGILKTAEGEFPVRAGDLMFLPPDVPHEYYPTEEIWETHWLAFAGRDARQTLEHIKLDRAKVVHVSDMSGLNAIFKKMMYLLKTNYYYSGHECSMHLYQFLIELHRVTNLRSGGQNSAKLDQLSPVIKHIDENYAKELTLAELAELIDLSPQYLCRLFKECLNLRPFEYLARRRIRQAKILLLEDRLNINEIAAAVGYNDHSYFCAVFKKHEMLSPAEFRSLHRNRDRRG